MAGVAIGHVVPWVVLILRLLGIIALAVLRPSPRRLVRSVGYGLGGIVALYLVGRAAAEFFTVDYSNPASYRNSWGGPSLVGVFLVHAGPGAVVVIAGIGYLLRWWPASRRRSPIQGVVEPEPQRRIR